MYHEGALGAWWAGNRELWLPIPDSSMDLLCDLRWGRAPFWNSLALFTNEGIGLVSNVPPAPTFIIFLSCCDSVGTLQKGGTSWPWADWSALGAKGTADTSQCPVFVPGRVSCPTRGLLSLVPHSPACLCSISLEELAHTLCNFSLYKHLIYSSHLASVYVCT